MATIDLGWHPSPLAPVWLRAPATWRELIDAIGVSQPVGEGAA